MLQFAQLFGVDRSPLQQRPVAVLALADRVDLALQFRDLTVEILKRDFHHGQLIAGLLMQGPHPVELLLLGEVAGPVVHAAQLGIDLGEVQQ